MNRVKYLTKDLLIKLNAKALRGKLNRSLQGLEDLDLGNKYPVTETFVCDDRIIRCWIALLAKELSDQQELVSSVAKMVNLYNHGLNEDQKQMLRDMYAELKGENKNAILHF